MQTLIALLFVAAAACAITRPPGPYTSTAVSEEGSLRNVGADFQSGRYFRDYVLPRYFWPYLTGYDESPQLPYPQPQEAATDWLSKEIDRINLMKEGVPMPHRTNLQRSMYDPYTKRILEPTYAQRIPPPSDYIPKMKLEPMPPLKESMTTSPPVSQLTKNEKKLQFALTPHDKGYFEPSNDSSPVKLVAEGIHEGGGQNMIEIEPPRQIRQNPNLSRTKTLIAENLDKLRVGLSNKDYRLPVSLLPSNLQWLKISRPNEVEQSGNDETASDKPHHIHVLEQPTPDPADSIYGVAVIAAIGAAIAMAVLGFGFGWYTLSKRAKAAADVDYPAYGVTGPTIDTSGDRKLAHSAHMYHYQHQKQQIIAMERNGMEQHNGSVSDPESEEENEEGHYTVYECPGFATTGDMEVKNPLFNDEPTPATPGKCEVVKPQTKD